MTDAQITELLRERLVPKRFQHSLNVAESARQLSVRYGGDPAKAYTAGLLHDVMKNAPPEEQLSYIAVLTPLEAQNPKLWHAMSAPAFVQAELGITDPDLLNALRYHTTGRAGMSLLEKQIFLADYIAAERDYDGVEIMRTLAQKRMEEAMLFALKFTLTNLSKKNKCIHPDCLHCYNDLILERKQNDGSESTL